MDKNEEIELKYIFHYDTTNDFLNRFTYITKNIEQLYIPINIIKKYSNIINKEINDDINYYSDKYDEFRIRNTDTKFDLTLKQKTLDNEIRNELKFKLDVHSYYMIKNLLIDNNIYTQIKKTRYEIENVDDYIKCIIIDKYMNIRINPILRNYDICEIEFKNLKSCKLFIDGEYQLSKYFMNELNVTDLILFKNKYIADHGLIFPNYNSIKDFLKSSN